MVAANNCDAGGEKRYGERESGRGCRQGVWALWGVLLGGRRGRDRPQVPCPLLADAGLS